MVVTEHMVADLAAFGMDERLQELLAKLCVLPTLGNLCRNLEAASLRSLPAHSAEQLVIRSKLLRSNPDYFLFLRLC